MKVHIDSDRDEEARAYIYMMPAAFLKRRQHVAAGLSRYALLLSFVSATAYEASFVCRFVFVRCHLPYASSNSLSAKFWFAAMPSNVHTLPARLLSPVVARPSRVCSYIDHENTSRRSFVWFAAAFTFTACLLSFVAQQ